jgi:hypothetical protein
MGKRGVQECGRARHPAFACPAPPASPSHSARMRVWPLSPTCNRSMHVFEIPTCRPSSVYKSYLILRGLNFACKPLMPNAANLA